VRLHASNAAGEDEHAVAGAVCALDPGSPPVGGLRFQDRVAFTWDGRPDARSYRVVRGDLAMLRSSGGWDQAGACLLAEVTDEALAEPSALARSTPTWYLVGAIDCAGSHDGLESGGAGQVAPRPVPDPLPPCP
jgi:hypothetical protein